MSDIGPPDWKQEYEEADHLREILTGRLNEFRTIWKRHHPDSEFWPDVAKTFNEVAKLLARYRWRPIAELHEELRAVRRHEHPRPGASRHRPRLRYGAG